MYKKFLVVVGHGPDACAAVAEASALARVHGAELLLFSVLPRYAVPVADMPMIGMPSPEDFERDARENVERTLAAASGQAEAAGVRHASAVGSGVDEAECIVDAAQAHGCDLVVVATPGSNAVMRLLGGSVIPGLITHARTPLLICR